MSLQLMEKIAGEITLSSTAGKTMKKWREIFGISQQVLAEHLQMSPSVISDYESGRRKSPGILTVKKIVQGIISIDRENGGEVIRKYDITNRCEAILSLREFPIGISSKVFIGAIKGQNITPNISIQRDVHGYTIIDSIRAITTLTSYEYFKVYGWSSERALIFTGVKYGRSPMIAIRAHPLKPAMVVYLSPDSVDELAIHLAELENIPLIVSDLSVSEVIESLGEL